MKKEQTIMVLSCRKSENSECHRERNVEWNKVESIDHIGLKKKNW